MRRARLQIKPNLSARAGARTQPSADAAPKPAAPVAALRLPVPQPATTAAPDGKTDNLVFTQLKPLESRSAESETSNSGSAVDIPAAQSTFPTAESAASDKSAQGLRFPSVQGLSLRSPRKSADAEQPKVSNVPAAFAQSKPDGIGPGDVAYRSPGRLRVRSPRKSVGSESDCPHTSTFSAGAAADAGVDAAVGKSAGLGVRAGSPVKKVAAPVVKPAVVRGARSRFKVRPNLAEAGKRGQK